MVQEFEKLFILWSAPIYVILILGEIILSNWINVKNNTGLKNYTFIDTLTNVYLMVANMGIDVLMRGISLFSLLFAYEHHIFELKTNPVLYWISLFLLEDIIFYWIHRSEHKIRLFWAVHVTHHSSEKFNLTTGFRSSVFQPIYRFLWFIPLCFIGFHPFDIFIIFSITQTYGILLHTNLIDRLGFLEYFLVTPSHHRVHHASNVEYLDKNMGMCLIIWDKLFGTFQAELDAVKPKFGLYEKTISAKPQETIFHEFSSIVKDLKRPLSFSERLKYLFKPPGWSHDGSSKTSEELRSEILTK
ncbi:MAG: sterol desaturase family protein [Flavobacteriia bacterium]